MLFMLACFGLLVCCVIAVIFKECLRKCETRTDSNTGNTNQQEARVVNGTATGGDSTSGANVCVIEFILPGTATVPTVP